MGLLQGFKKIFFLTAFCCGGVCCATGVLLSTLATVLPIPLAAREKWTRRMIHRLCATFTGYMRLFGLLEVDFGELRALGNRRGVIIAGNHPTYIDAVLMMSQLPDVFCLTKVDNLRNPWLAAMLRSAGYENNADPRPLVKNCSARLARGETLLVFPEGTRTSHPPLGPLKRGFALMAITAHAPVLTVLVTSFNGPFLRKGQPFISIPPTVPLRYQFSISTEFLPADGTSTREFSMTIENHFRTTLPATTA